MSETHTNSCQECSETVAEAGVPLAVSRWSEVFETSVSRRFATLSWISIPVSFNSTGLQRLLDDFGPIKAAALYGAWCMLLKIAATAPTRGVLAGQKGEAYTPGRLARLSGLQSPELFAELLTWAVSVGWLRSAHTADTLHNGPNITKPNGTERNGTREANAAVPCRAVSVNAHKSQEAGGTEKAHHPADSSQPDGSQDRPDLVTLADVAKGLDGREMQAVAKALSELERVSVARGTAIHGSIWGKDRIRQVDVLDGTADWWLTWYRDQLASRSPCFRLGNAAELVFVLAAVYAVRSCSDTSLKGTTRAARLIDWLRKRRCNDIRFNAWKRAIADVRELCNAPKAGG